METRELASAGEISTDRSVYSLGMAHPARQGKEKQQKADTGTNFGEVKDRSIKLNAV
jgi:hypothetical protein